MATIDSREGDDSFRGEVYLKIWWWDKISGSWILNTRVDRPHGLAKVTAVAFTPGVCDHNALLLVTSGEDGNIKSWRIRVSKDKKGTEEGERFSESFTQHFDQHKSRSLLGLPVDIHLQRGDT